MAAQYVQKTNRISDNNIINKIEMRTRKSNLVHYGFLHFAVEYHSIAYRSPEIFK